MNFSRTPATCLIYGRGDYSLALFLYLFLPLASLLLFPCAGYPAWETHLVHEIPSPNSLC